MATPTTPRIKIALVGDGGVGKTTLLKRHVTGDFITSYNPTHSVFVSRIKMSTNHGEIVLDIHDTAGQEKYDGKNREKYLGIDGAIVMYDLTNGQSYKHVKGWINDILSIVPDCPIILAGNKADLANDSTEWVSCSGYLSYPVSAKSMYNYEKPFLAIARAVTHIPDLNYSDSLGTCIQATN